MPKVNHVKSARKDNPVAKKGEPYYWWAFRFSGKRYSKTYPKRSQLTQSAFLQTLYDLEDSISDRFANLTTMDEVEEAKSSLSEEIEDLMNETQDSLDAMPDHLQESSTSGELLQERIDALESWISDLDSVDLELDERSDMAPEEQVQNAIDELVSFGADL